MSSYCNNIIEICIDYPLIQSCNGGFGCKNMRIQCSSFEIICVKADNTCNNHCECLSNITICKEWSSECIKYSDECKNTTIEKDLTNCLKNISICDTDEDLEIQCKYSCEWNSEVYKKTENEYEAYLNAYNISQVELKGFEDIKELVDNRIAIADIVRIESITGQRNLNETGIGPNDIVFQSLMKIISIKDSDLAEDNLDILWNFFNNVTNQEELLIKAKEAIIELSDGSLTTELNNKLATEIIQENIKNA